MSRKAIFILLFLFTASNGVALSKKTEESFLSLKFNEINVRAGPSVEFPLILTYKTMSLPVKVVAEYDNWYKIIDKDGDGGWVRKSSLSNYRTIITVEDGIIYSGPNEEAYPKYKVEKDVILGLIKCKGKRCKVLIKIGKNKDKGWLDRTGIWGV
jgi:SH3-like domain-containing protein